MELFNSHDQMAMIMIFGRNLYQFLQTSSFISVIKLSLNSPALFQSTH
jgi:hypothetical protein